MKGLNQEQYSNMNFSPVTYVPPAAGKVCRRESFIQGFSTVCNFMNVSIKCYIYVSNVFAG